MRDTVQRPPREARVIAALVCLDEAADMDIVERHATIITGAMLHLLASYRANGFEIGLDDDGAYAKPKVRTAGPARELRDLARNCRKACAGKIGLREWTTIWAAQPQRITALWKKPLIKTEDGGRTIDGSEIAMGFYLAGDRFARIAPKPERVLPAIEAALAEITATPQSKTRKGNDDEAEAIEVIRSAYREITGHKGSRVIRDDKLAGRLHDLRREIGDIFNVTLFDVKDSKRLR